MGRRTAVRASASRGDGKGSGLPTQEEVHNGGGNKTGSFEGAAGRTLLPVADALLSSAQRLGDAPQCVPKQPYCEQPEQDTPR